jgi:hypothetical protein
MNKTHQESQEFLHHLITGSAYKTRQVISIPENKQWIVVIKEERPCWEMRTDYHVIYRVTENNGILSRQEIYSEKPTYDWEGIEVVEDGIFIKRHGFEEWSDGIGFVKLNRPSQ